MTKKLIAGLALCLSVLLVCPAYAETHFYGGGQVSFNSQTTDRWGGGTDFRLGFTIPLENKPFKAIVWTPAVFQIKTGEGLEANQYMAGGSLLFPWLITKIRLSIFANLDVGFGDIEGEEGDDLEFGSVIGGGLYSNLSDKWTVWGGFNNQNIAGDPKVDVWTFHLGVSFCFNPNQEAGQ